MSSGFRSTAGFLHGVDRLGELAVIDAPVDPRLEVSEIADREMRRPGGGRALLFQNPRGAKLPLAMNLFGSARRMALAIGHPTIEDAHEHIRRIASIEPPQGLGGILDLLQTLFGLRHALPRRRGWGGAPVAQVEINPPDLGLLPVPTTWPEDGGPFLTLPQVYSVGPDGRPNLGMYRMQVYDSRTTGMHWQRHKDGRAQADATRDVMPVAVAFGGPPVLTFAATAPLPPGIFELLLAGFLGRRRIPVAMACGGRVPVPVEGDILLEGHVDPRRLRVEGPFGDHTGFYSAAGLYPEFHVERMRHRCDAILPATLVGPPPKEDTWLGLATERIFLPLLQRIHSELADWHLPPATCFHNLVIASVRSRFPGHARKLAHAIWGTGQLMFTKFVVAVDAGVDPRDPVAVMQAMARNWNARQDTMVSRGPTDTLDHASDIENLGGKALLDATSKGPENEAGPTGSDEPGPDRVDFPAHVHPALAATWVPPGSQGRVLVLRVTKERPGDGIGVLLSISPEMLPPSVLLVVAVDEPAALGGVVELAAVTAGNIDPARDLFHLASRRPGGCLGLDATHKVAEEGWTRGAWPKWLEQDPDVVAQVTRRWTEYGL